MTLSEVQVSVVLTGKCFQYCLATLFNQTSQLKFILANLRLQQTNRSNLNHLNPSTVMHNTSKDHACMEMLHGNETDGALFILHLVQVSSLLHSVVVFGSCGLCIIMIQTVQPSLHTYSRSLFAISVIPLPMAIIVGNLP